MEEFWAGQAQSLSAVRKVEVKNKYQELAETDDEEDEDPVQRKDLLA